jgi:hypothetical protein
MMPDNNQISAGGDISGNAAINTGSGSVNQSVQATSGSRDAVLKRIDETLAALLQASLTGLPADQAKVVMTEAVTLKTEVHEASPDHRRVRHALAVLKAAAASAALVVELVHQLAGLVTQVLH